MCVYKTAVTSKQFGIHSENQPETVPPNKNVPWPQRTHHGQLDLDVSTRLVRCPSPDTNRFADVAPTTTAAATLDTRQQ